MKERGPELLEAHLRSFDPDAPTARSASKRHSAKSSRGSSLLALRPTQGSGEHASA